MSTGLREFDGLRGQAVNPSLPSELQIAIDHSFKGTNVTMVLCGSNEGFMEGEVLGSKSPLYGRRAAQIRLRPLDCMDVRDMLPGVSATDVVRCYATFGGTPYYVEQVDVAQGYDENVARLLFSTSGLLYAEPSMLLRQELRERPSRGRWRQASPCRPTRGRSSSACAWSGSPGATPPAPCRSWRRRSAGGTLVLA